MLSCKRLPKQSIFFFTHNPYIEVYVWNITKCAQDQKGWGAFCKALDLQP